MARMIASGIGLALALALAADAAGQGSQTGTIRGAAVDSQGLSLPGVTVTVGSPSLQGTRTAVTDINGNYSLPQLPPGTTRLGSRWPVSATLRKLRPFRSAARSASTRSWPPGASPRRCRW